jgi:predicted benzoate:H+ symporter BenE
MDFATYFALGSFIIAFYFSGKKEFEFKEVLGVFVVSFILLMFAGVLSQWCFEYTNLPCGEYNKKWK